MKKVIASLAVLMAVLMIACPVSAAQRTVTEVFWTNPSTRESGAPVLSGELAAVALKCGASVGSYTLNYRHTSGMTPGALVTVPLGTIFTVDGSYYCVATAEDSNGVNSADSVPTVQITKAGGVFTVAHDGLTPPAGLGVR